MGKRYTKAQVLQAIKASGGVMSVVQQRLGCASWDTARKYVEKWNETREAFISETYNINDLARSVVITDIKGGNVQTAKWWLERRVREEFSDKTGIDVSSQSSSDDTTLRIIIDNEHTE